MTKSAALKPWDLTEAELNSVRISPGYNRFPGGKPREVREYPYLITFIDFCKSRVYIATVGIPFRGYEAMMQKPCRPDHHYHSKLVDSIEKAKTWCSSIVRQAFNDSDIRDFHRYCVKVAIKKGVDIPVKVLAEYPELARN